MNYEISEVIVDLAGKYRVRVIIDEYSTQFFKFDHIPSQEEVNNIIENYKSVSNNITLENNNDQTGL